MKQKLLLFILPMLFFSVTLKAQQVWDFSLWPDQGEQTTTSTVDGLTIVPGSGSGFAIIESNGHTFPDSFMSTKRFKGGGSSSGDASTLPTRRYLTFDVTGNSTVKIWARASGSSTPRALSLMDATATEVGHFDSTGSTDGFILESNYVGAATTLYIHFIDNAFNLYKIEATNVVLGVEDVSPVSTNIKAIGDRIYVSNVKLNTEVNIYSIAGALVKSFKTNSDTDFNFKSGLYIATVKTIEGQKAVKLLTH